MKKIKNLEDHIHEELDDSKKYIKCALKYKDDDRELGDLFYWLSQEEMSHADKIHKAIVDVISEYRRKEGEPPAEMMAIYNYLHDREIEKAKEIKLLWSMYKG